VLQQHHTDLIGLGKGTLTENVAISAEKRLGFDELKQAEKLKADFVFLSPVIEGINVMDMSAGYLFSIGAMFGPTVVLEGEIWRLFSAMFLHGGAEHVLMNMLSLYLVGRSVERIFSALSYLFLYFISGLIGSLVSIYFHRDFDESVANFRGAL